jgi:hypothetical protein
MIKVDKIYGFGKYCQSKSHKPTTVSVMVDGTMEKRTVRTHKSRYGFIVWRGAKVGAIMCERCWFISVAETIKQLGPEFTDLLQFSHVLGPKEMHLADA